MFNTKRPINKVEDLAGMKIRTGGGIAEEMAQALGASAFVKPAPESYELLRSGVADGMFFPLESIISFKLDTVLKYATLFPGGFYSSAFGFFMNEDKWNKLSKQDQDAIMSVSGEALARLAGKAWDATDRAALEVMKKVGIQISEASPELVKGVQERSEGHHREVGQGRHRQGRRRRQGLRRVPRRAEARRRRQVSGPTRRWTSTTLRGGAWLDRVLGAAAAVLLFCLMALTTVDVIGRYLFNRPLRGAFEITELLLLTLIFAGLPLVSRADEHVTMDFIDRLLGATRPRVLLRRLVDLRVRRHRSWASPGGCGSRPARSRATATPPTCCASRSGRSSISWR